MFFSLLLVVAASALDGGENETESEPVDAGTLEVPSSIAVHAAAEAALAAFPSGFGENGFDVIASLHPVAGFSVGEDFGLELGPTFRFRLIDTPAWNRSSDMGGVLRGADWDELSDFGQIVSSLRIGNGSGPFQIRAGPQHSTSLGLGHLVWRYSNQNNPNYHPAGASAVLRVGPVRGELVVSDVLGARLFAGEVAWDIGGTFSNDEAVADRYVLAAEVAHDANLTGLPFRPEPNIASRVVPSVTLFHLDANAVLVRNSALRWLLVAGIGTRANAAADLGFVVGTAVDAAVKDIGFSARLELRKQAGGFRHGFFGPMYELQRFVDIGFSGPSIGSAALPDGFSSFAELRFALGTHLTFDAAVEYFFWNRLDLHGGLALAVLDDWLFVTARTSILGLGHMSRYAFTTGLRWRLFPGFYVLGEGGTAFFPQVDGTLLRSIILTAGVGIDFER